jgi:hypothetical protein
MTEPTTEAGIRDHDEAWNDYAESEYHMLHDALREGCGGCEAIADIEAEARAAARADFLVIGADNLAYLQGKRDALAEAAEKVRALRIPISLPDIDRNFLDRAAVLAILEGTDR